MPQKREKIFEIVNERLCDSMQVADYIIEPETLKRSGQCKKQDKKQDFGTLFVYTTCKQHMTLWHRNKKKIRKKRTTIKKTPSLRKAKKRPRKKKLSKKNRKTRKSRKRNKRNKAPWRRRSTTRPSWLISC